MREHVESVLVDVVRFYSGMDEIDLTKTAKDHGLDSLDAVAVSIDVFEQLGVTADPQEFDAIFTEPLSRVVDFLVEHTR